MVGYETHFFFMETEVELKQLIEDYFKESEYKIIEYVFRGEKGTKVLEIFVDNINGINIDEITKINKELSSLIDERLILNDVSNLVVSSPGADRPLKFIWQLYKHIGRTLVFEMYDTEKIEGKLIGIREEGGGKILLETEIKETGKKNLSIEREINFLEIKEIKVKISFSKK